MPRSFLVRYVVHTAIHVRVLCLMHAAHWQLNEAIGGEADAVFLIVGSTGTPSGSGLDFINGMTFLERFYSVYDTGNKRVGFATTAFTDATSN